MSIEELFLRQIDSVDGNIEVIAHPGQPMTCVSFGPFVWQVENIDRDAVIVAVAKELAGPMTYQGSRVDLASGEVLQINVQKLRDNNSKLLWFVSGSVNVRLSFGTASLLVAALSEARQWQRTQLLAAGGEVASC